MVTQARSGMHIEGGSSNAVCQHEIDYSRHMENNMLLLMISSKSNRQTQQGWQNSVHAVR